MRTEYPQKIPKYSCEICGIKTNNKKDYNKHILTQKHIYRTNLGSIEQENPHNFVCKKCNKIYKVRNSLWYHERKCDELSSDKNTNTDTDKNNDVSELKSLVIEVMKSNNELHKQNIELQKQMIDVCKNIQPNITNQITNSNNNNKTFNLHFFLNEQCKDAMNISEFINSFSLSVNDLENVGKLGYVEGISSIIIKELNSLDIHKRPVHCSDVKRETLYIKDEDKWEKEGQENKKIKNVIRSVEHKNLKMINEWTKEHPMYKGSNDKDNDAYLKIMLESAGGTGNYEEKGIKIIKKIAKEVVIEK